MPTNYEAFPSKDALAGIDIPPPAGPPFEPAQQPPLFPLEPGTVHVVNPVHYNIYREHENAQRHAGDGSRAMATIYDDFLGICQPKRLGRVPEDFAGTFSRLKERFPNSTAMLEVFEGACYRGMLRPTKCIPTVRVLLLGQPGIGKTHALEDLTAALGLHIHRLSMNGQVGAFELRGLGRHWRNPHPGAVAKCFRDSPVANPVFLLDELDKGRTNSSDYGSSVDTLLDLLEGINAKAFRDECLDLPIDARHAIFVATANDVTRLPEPLVSRFTTIEIKAPTREQMASVLASIFRDVVALEEGVFDPVLPQEVMSILLSCTPRKAKQYLDCAVNAAAARTVRAGKRRRRPIRIEPGDLPPFSTSQRRAIGFIHQKSPG